MLEKTYYVYQYITETGAPYYIGKGKGNRIHVDHKHIALPPKERRIIIQDSMTNEDAKKLEGELISKYGRKLDGGILDNIKINQWACRAGWKHSIETIEKIRNGNLGKVRTEDHKQKYRQPKSVEHKENIKKARLGTTRSDETKKKISETMKKNIPWNKGKTGSSWSEARRQAHLTRKAIKENI